MVISNKYYLKSSHSGVLTQLIKSGTIEPRSAVAALRCSHHLDKYAPVPDATGGVGIEGAEFGLLWPCEPRASQSADPRSVFDSVFDFDEDG